MSRGILLGLKYKEALIIKHALRDKENRDVDEQKIYEKFTELIEDFRIEELNQEIKQLQAENARLMEKETPKELVCDEHNRFYCDRCGKEISMPQYTPYRYCQFCGGRIKDEAYE